MHEILILAPASGSKLLLTDGAYFVDQATTYTFEMILKPVWADGYVGQWQSYGLQVRHNSAVVLTVTPIVDNEILSDQASLLAVALPTGWARSVAVGRMQAWGKKATLKIQASSTGAFYLEGAWFDVRVQDRHVPQPVLSGT